MHGNLKRMAAKSRYESTANSRSTTFSTASTQPSKDLAWRIYRKKSSCPMSRKDVLSEFCRSGRHIGMATIYTIRVADSLRLYSWRLSRRCAIANRLAPVSYTHLDAADDLLCV